MVQLDNNEFKTYLPICCHVSACFSCCTETGLRIYHVEPLGQQEKFGKLSSILKLTKLDTC